MRQFVARCGCDRDGVNSQDCVCEDDDDVVCVWCMTGCDMSAG